ncbi:MAG: hypothetical protein KBF88_03070 [Polyangiaceae bacterium]|nr:hypothetical protein [Polyangiaceae bacterium]
MILRPSHFLAVLVLVLNDHLFKVAYPSWVTGKLSDVAGLYFFPALLVAGRDLLFSNAIPKRRDLLLASLATAIVFSLVKTTVFGASCYRFGLGALQWPGSLLVAMLGQRAMPPLHTVSLVRDPSDLLALPFAFGTYVHQAIRNRASKKRRHCVVAEEPLASRDPYGAPV